ncbi:MAG: ABC transporter ATP-binding protein [Bacteroidota bacterium]
MELVIQNLSKTYPNGVRALQNVSLTIQQGMFGLLGPNGAGKSTLMRSIATLQEPDGGKIVFDGIDVRTQKEDLRKVLGYLPQEFGVYPKVSAEKLLDHLAVLKGISNTSERKELVEALLHKTNLYEARKKNLGGYSGGMKQRFGIAQALLASPKLIIVDEPTAGLDPAERNRFHNLLSELGEEAVVILSTHIVDDVKKLCTNMAIINQGQILMTGNPKESIKQVEGKIWQKKIAKGELPKYKDAFNVISDRLETGETIINILADNDPGQGFSPVDPGLEDVYFSYIFGGIKEKAAVAG